MASAGQTDKASISRPTVRLKQMPIRHSTNVKDFNDLKENPIIFLISNPSTQVNFLKVRPTDVTISVTTENYTDCYYHCEQVQWTLQD